MINKELNRVLKLLADEKSTEAKISFYNLEPEESVEYYMIKGKLEKKFQNWGVAMNAFLKVLELDPENVEGKYHLQIVQNILNFWNPEMFNP